MTRARDQSKLANPEVFSVDTDNNIGINSSSPDAKVDILGVVSATSYSGDGSKLTGIIAGATLSDANGTQRLVVTSQTTGSMTEAGTNGGLTYASNTNVLSATNFSGSLSGNATGLQDTANITVKDITAEQISIGGTLTYEDVTNINSIGIVTANKGINVPNYGIDVTGVVTATSYRGDGKNLSGIERGRQNFVATGNIHDGSPVVINTDGTVGIVTLSTISEAGIGATETYLTGQPEWISSAYIGNNKIFVAFRQEASVGNGEVASIVGTISGTNISFGGKVSVDGDGSNQAYNANVSYLANDKVLVSYGKKVGLTTYREGFATVGEVSGTSISYAGSLNKFADNIEWLSATPISSSKVLLSYVDQNDHATGKCRVADISGTTVTFGTEVTFNSNSTNEISSAYDSVNDKVIISYLTGNQGTNKVATISGTNVTLSNATVFNSSTGLHTTVYDSINQKAVIVFYDNGNSGRMTARVATISSNGTVTYGDKVQMTYAFDNERLTSTFDSVNGKIIIATTNESINQGMIRVGTVSGTTISFPGTLSQPEQTNYGADNNANYNNFHSITFDPDSQKSAVFFGLSASDPNRFGKANVFTDKVTQTNLTSENYIGFAKGAISDGQSGKINVVGGISTSQSGLTTGRKYYVQANGGISTTAGSPSVPAGFSISSSSIIVQKS